MNTHRFSTVFALLAGATIVACGSSQSPGSNGAASSVDVDGFARPDSSQTPGKVLTTDVNVISQPGYTKTVRNVPDSEKEQVAAAYSYTGPSSGVEYDHLVSLEIGGSNNPGNIWPQPIEQARVKDQLEDYLHRQVVAGTMDLKDAQAQIAADWIALYQKTLGAAPSNHAMLAAQAPTPTLGTNVGDACDMDTGCDPDANLYCQNGSCASCDDFGDPTDCSDGTELTYIPSFDGTTCVMPACSASCNAPTDCMGDLPDTSERCDDGTTQTARWDCVQSTCQLTICQENQGITASGS